MSLKQPFGKDKGQRSEDSEREGRKLCHYGGLKTSLRFIKTQMGVKVTSSAAYVYLG